MVNCRKIYPPGEWYERSLWDKVLTDEEINQLAQGADPRTVASEHLVLFYRIGTPMESQEVQHG